MKIEVLKEDGTKIGYDEMNNASFDWHMRFAKAFDFIPYEEFLHDYERGHFYLTDSKEYNKIDDTVKFIVTKFSLLKRDCDLSNPFSCKNEWKDF